MKSLLGFILICIAGVIVILALFSGSSSDPTPKPATAAVSNQPVTPPPATSRSISESEFVGTYVAANRGQDDYDDTQLAQLARDAYRMSGDDSTLKASAMWNKNVARALDFNSKSGTPPNNPQDIAKTDAHVSPIEADALLTSLQSGQSTEASYRGRLLTVAGVVSALFVPDVQTQMRMAEKGHTAYPLLTMAGPSPSSVEEILFLPGITAYSEGGSIFGLAPSDASRLAIGERVILTCTFQSAHEALAKESAGRYSIILEGCKADVVAPHKPEIIRNGVSISKPSGEGNGDITVAYRPGEDGVTNPVIVYKVQPEFSDEARKARYEGSVLVGLTVGADGLPKDPHVIRPLGLGLDEKAIEAVRQFRFAPAMKEGKAVPVQFAVEVNFKIER